MVQARLAGRKTQTRRLVKGLAKDFLQQGFTPEYVAMKENHFSNYEVGDILWVRETWSKVPKTAYGSDHIYRADFDRAYAGGWKPSIHMKREAARLFQKVTEVRIERLQEISKEDAIREGIQPLLMSSMQRATSGQLYRNYQKEPEFFNDGLSPIESFKSLWQSIYGQDSWDANPYVWVYTFEKVEKPENFLTPCQ